MNIVLLALCLCLLLIAALLVMLMRSRANLYAVQVFLRHYLAGDKQASALKPLVTPQTMTPFCSEIALKVERYINFQTGQHKPAEITGVADLRKATMADAVFICCNDSGSYGLEEMSCDHELSGQSVLTELELYGLQQNYHVLDLRNFMHSKLAHLGFSTLHCFKLQALGSENTTLEIFFAYQQSTYTLAQQVKLRVCANQYLLAYETKKSERNFEQKISASQQENKDKSNFISGLSHDLRSPVNNIQAILLCLESSVADSADQELLLHAKSNLNFLKTLVEDLLSLAKFRSGNLTPSPQKFLPLAALTDVISAQRFDAESKGLSLSLVNSNPEFEISSDLLYFKRIIQNLLSNAIKYTVDGAVTVEVKFQKTGLRVNVTDTGGGLSKEQIETICLPFMRYDQTNTDGIGIGLTVSKLLIEQLGGKLVIKSKVGEGSRFSFKLPKQFQIAPVR